MNSSMLRSNRRMLVALLLIFPVVLISVSYLEDLAESSGFSGASGFISYIEILPSRIIELASNAGYAGIFTLMLLEAAALPIPSEIILPFAGYLVSQGELEFWPTVFYTTLAALIGSFIDYYIGWKIGRPILTGQYKLPFIETSRLQRVEAWFNAHGPAAVTLLRLVPAARVLISFPAGAYRMGKLKFAACTLAGCLPWNVALMYAGWWLGSSWHTVVEAFSYFNLIVYVLLAIAVVWVVTKLRSKRVGRRTWPR